MSLPMARLASSPTSPNNPSLRTPMIQNGVENNVVVSTTSQGTGQNQQTSASINTQESFESSNSMACPHSSATSLGVQDDMAPNTEQNIPAPATPIYAQQQVTPYGYAPSMAKRGADYLTDERLLGLSQTCKVFRDVCHGFGAHDYLMVWAEYDHFLRDDFMRLFYLNHVSLLYVSRSCWDDYRESSFQDQVRSIITNMENLVSLEIHCQKKPYDTLRKALFNHTVPGVKSLTLDSLCANMATMIRYFPNLRRMQFLVCPALTSDVITVPLERLPQLKHLFLELNVSHTQVEDANMIEALMAHSNIKKFTMLRNYAYEPVSYARVYDNEATVANTYFDHVPHLEEIGICNAQPYGQMPDDTGKVFIRITTKVKATKPAGTEDGKGLDSSKLNKTDKNSKLPETTTNERRRLLRVYDRTQSKEHRIKQLKSGCIPPTTDRSPKPAEIYLDPEYSMLELEWKWARHQILTEMYDRKREAAEAAKANTAAASPDVSVVEGVPAAEPAGSPAVSNAATAGSSSPLSSLVPLGYDSAADAAPHTGEIVPASVFGGGSAAAAVANAPLALEDAGQKSIADASGSSSESSTPT
ncbi:hypothetical protein SMACR_01156 [Sordaria macrospora]|uniref:WGS project CABT00000000 data, contig 2.2 n=2 Tax=Sordaria macrospora TaxID=5147 RepID=F7VMF1_SORMK|nr:uncharacterized protein SMAC_01156 [Sordaria macrospora k-hell]KAA8629010.1 hypothetical protein SMACR_01156 [Sordaria macrospora]CCC07132.1 unnamed protein product [Sordaria macrospora k-hell]